MKKILYTLCALQLISCNSAIKNENAKVIVEEGTESGLDTTFDENKPKLPMQENDLIGFWVGYFEKKEYEGSWKKNVHADEGFEWNRENKINISIDSINGNSVSGHSVVAGNNRPFSGTVTKDSGKFKFIVKEPGNNKFDGAFTFMIKDSTLAGTWKAFEKIEIPKREYELKKVSYNYNPVVMLEQNAKFIDWTAAKKKGWDSGDGYYTLLFASATKNIYSINASSTILTKAQVENLMAGDLLVIRNTIYARHGYSFKNRPLRVFFDHQRWYIPVHTDIKAELTEIEKKNIDLLLRYEKNAKEYYDYFGRG